MAEINLKDLKELFPFRTGDTNKGNFGYVAILGGCLNYSGAIKLANLSCTALKSGCGVSKLIVAKSLAPIVAPYLLEQTLSTIDDNDYNMIFNPKQIDESLHNINALAIGMGWGNRKRQ